MTLCWVRPVCQALDLHSLGLAPCLPEDGTPPPAKEQLFPGPQSIACLDRAVTETWHKRYLLVCTSSLQTPMAWLQAEKCKQDENCRVEIASFEISLFKAPWQITVTGPDPRTVPLTMTPEMCQNTVKQRGKISSLYTESTRGLTSISCADAGTYMNKPTQGICLFALRRRTCHVQWFTMYIHLGKDRPQAAETVRSFLCDLLLGTITVCFSPLNLRCVTTCVQSPSLSSCFSSTEAAASEVQMAEFTALTPKQKDLQQDYLNWVPLGNQMLFCTSELFSTNQQNLNCSENGQHQNNTFKSICTRSQPKNTYGKLQVFFLLCKQRNKGTACPDT